MKEEKDKINLILASGSPRRKQLLGFLNIPFEIHTADIDETSNKATPEDQACDISEQKGRAVLEKFSPENSLIISSDTMVILDNKIFGKPGTVDKARTMLKELSGKTHQVVTAVTFIFPNGESHNFFDSTKVSFNSIDDDILEDYLKTEDSLDKAGAYGIQGASLTFIARLEGSYSNVVGFPLEKVVNELKNTGYWERLRS